MKKSAPISPYDLGICESRHLSHRFSGLYSSNSPPAAPSGAIDECLGTFVDQRYRLSTVLIHENWTSIQNWDPTAVWAIYIYTYIFIY